MINDLFSLLLADLLASPNQNFRSYCVVALAIVLLLLVCRRFLRLGR